MYLAAKRREILPGMFLFLILFVFPSTGYTQGNFSGYIMGYYNHNISSDGPETNGKYNETILKRIYLHYDYDISDRFETRLTIESNQKNIGTSGKYEPYIKFAFLRWKKFIPRGDLLIGLSQSPVWANEENLWNYWSVEKTLFDTRDLGNPCDIGIALKGKFDKSEIWGYHIMAGHGNGYKPENDKYKKFYCSLSAAPKKYLFFELVTDYEKKNSSDAAKTFKCFAAFMQPGWLVGVETGRRYDEHQKDIVRQGISLFGRTKLSRQLNVLARFDDFNWDKDKNETGDRLWLLGIDYHPHNQVRFIPNIWIKSYKDTKLDTDIIGRLTVHFIF
ncbi:MAG: hypothetical protein HOC71_03870 [Candidatus Latescibacteria bacterium]|jgi:hypothetical protein|nr:hypothetical protein [Candidatus Latescibacterota bacterium]